jgi:hypothetical protein
MEQNKIRITNVDTLSAYFDRLIVERIKWFFFVKDNNTENIAHQETVIEQIKSKITDLLESGEFEYLAERRTFSNELLVNLDSLIVNNIHIGESDRARLQEVKSTQADVNVLIEQEKRLRTANEGRAQNKNKIDGIFFDLTHREVFK